MPFILYLVVISEAVVHLEGLRMLLVNEGANERNTTLHRPSKKFSLGVNL